MKLFDILNAEDRLLGSQIGFSRGDILFQEGEICQGVFFVLKGQIKIVSVSLQGKEIVFNRLDEGTLFGNNLAFASDPRFRGNVMATSDGEIFYLGKESLLVLLQRNEEFLKGYLRFQSDFGKSLNAKIKILSLDAPAERLEFYLQTRGGQITYKTITDLADEVGLRRETLSRTISELVRKGRIVKTGKSIQFK